MKPAIQFLELLVHNPENIFKEYIVREENRRKGLKTIKSYCTTNNADNSGDCVDIFDIEDDNNQHVTKSKKRTVRKKKSDTLKDKNDVDVFDDDFMLSV